MTCSWSTNRCARIMYMSGWSRLITKVHYYPCRMITSMLMMISQQEVTKHVAHGVSQDLNMAHSSGDTSSGMLGCAQLHPASAHQPFCLSVCRQCNALDNSCWLWFDWRIHSSIRGIRSKAFSQLSIILVQLTYIRSPWVCTST